MLGDGKTIEYMFEQTSSPCKTKSTLNRYDFECIYKTQTCPHTVRPCPDGPSTIWVGTHGFKKLLKKPMVWAAKHTTSTNRFSQNPAQQDALSATSIVCCMVHKKILTGNITSCRNVKFNHKRSYDSRNAVLQKKHDMEIGKSNVVPSVDWMGAAGARSGKT